MNLIELQTFLKYGFTEVKKSSIVDVQLGSKYASVSMTFHLTFLKRTSFIVEIFYKVLFSQREIKS